MATIKAFTSAGEAGADIAFDDAQLTLDRGQQAMKDAVTAIRNSMRAGTASPGRAIPPRSGFKNRFPPESPESSVS